ncbi:hypothetical protein ACQEVZ_20275 [Dactylosporangium sp. CA-152071]|uniref:hypothetical protein n=1 Tax=Dactylosporangium sp. CA-152071 TaxID=3239933 RepID=UPI003D905D65
MADITWHGDEILAELHDASVRGLTAAAEHLLQVSRTQVPIEEGTLERSGTATVDAEDRSAAVAYDTVYATRQHEDMTLRHDGGRKAKYLEDPYIAERDTMLELIAAEARRALR